MIIVDKRNDSAIIVQRIPSGRIFSLVEGNEEYFMKIARERLRQAIKGEIEIPKGALNCEFAVRLSDGTVCRLDPQARCCVYPQAELVIKS